MKLSVHDPFEKVTERGSKEITSLAQKRSTAAGQVEPAQPSKANRTTFGQFAFGAAGLKSNEQVSPYAVSLMTEY